MLIRSVDYLFEAIKIINPSDAFSKTEEKLAWQNALSAAESSMEILRIVLHFLLLVVSGRKFFRRKQK